MSTPFNAAMAAYGNTAQLIGQSAKPGVEKVASLGGDNAFADFLSQSVQGLVESGKNADRQAMALVEGKADVVDVVTAISQTEIAMETMVTVRDRVISAYEEIMRMPI